MNMIEMHYRNNKKEKTEIKLSEFKELFLLYMCAMCVPGECGGQKMLCVKELIFSLRLSHPYQALM